MNDMIAIAIAFKILQFGVPWILLILFAYMVFCHPEKVQKWSVLFWKIVRYFWREAEKYIIANDIEGRVNDFSKNMSKELVNFEPIGVQIQWVKDGEDRDHFFRDNKLIIRMREHKNQDKNFVYASMVFISKYVLRKVKKYISKSQKESIDLYIAKRLYNREKARVLDEFFEDFFALKIDANKKIATLIEQYHVIDKVGLFFPALITELTFLGEKVYFKLKRDPIIKEVTQLIKYLENYANRELGDEKTPLVFEGIYCRCGIMIIAKRFKVIQIGDIEPYVKYIKKLLERKIEDIYLIGPDYEKNLKFIDEISYKLQEEMGLQKYHHKKYKSRIIIHGERKEVDTCLVLLRSREILRYYDEEYQNKYIEASTES